MSFSLKYWIRARKKESSPCDVCCLSLCVLNMSLQQEVATLSSLALTDTVFLDFDVIEVGLPLVETS